MENKTTLIIADGHQILIEGIASLLQQVHYVEIIGTAISGNELLEMLSRQEADMVILDLLMEGKDGLPLHRHLSQQFPQLKVLILSPFNDWEITASLMELNISGCLLKNSNKLELIRAIKDIAEGTRYFSEEVKAEYMKRIFSTNKKRGNIPVISPREREILKYISLELTAQQIGEKLFISQNTVNTHRRNLLSKFNVKNTAGLVRVAFQKGILQDMN